MIDICLLLEGTYPYVTGGVSTWVHSLISGLPEFKFGLVHFSNSEKVAMPKFILPQNLVHLENIPLNIRKDSIHLDALLSRIPEAKVYHALSTGFAGLLATRKKQMTNSPMILTEHGIYWHEIELGVDELECGFKIIHSKDGRIKLGRSWEEWLFRFKLFARTAYEAADRITTVCVKNRDMQISQGAPPSKCEVIANAVDMLPFRHINKKFFENDTINIGLVGRVTSIKDIKTFIKACALVKERLPKSQFYVIGPTDQDVKYFKECRKLASSLNLSELHFTGDVDPMDYYEILDVAVLTSQSEGQPFALIEAMAAGIPLVATDVGGCRELLHPAPEMNCAAGILCPAGDALRVSQAIQKLCTNETLWNSLSRCGKQIVATRHREKLFLDAYRNLYAKYLVLKNLQMYAPSRNRLTQQIEFA